ncbi:TetR/AcrR family transcriptional regulator [Saccharomonospora sp. NPDC046836]|uniref:TetR/AcrR family transcriptional regulator n=1 Tax=Saccharomonospora sp. NPDC046836 TaxID=3156921 RepID=UPI0033DA049A
MPRRTDTRARMLDKAATLFHAQGYHATGLNQLLSEGGLPKGSLYFHFPGGKEQLAVEALAISGGHVCQLLRETLAAAPDPASALRTAIDELGRVLTESDYRQGCPLSTVALDAAADSEPIRLACAEGFGSWQAVIEEALTGAGLDAKKAASLATVTVSSVTGALILARTQRDLAPLHAVANHLCATLDKELS